MPSTPPYALVTRDWQRCPDCGHYWPVHFTRDEDGRTKVLGCRPNAAALRDAIGRTPVLIRRARWGLLRGHTIVIFRDTRDPDSGTVLALDLDVGEYIEMRMDLKTWSFRVGGLDLERAKERVEEWLGYAVRVVGR